MQPNSTSREAPSDSERSSGTGPEPLDRPRLHAVLVGIDLWEPSATPLNTPIPVLEGCREDAIALARFLVEGPPAAEPSSVRLLLSPPRVEDTVAGADGLPEGLEVGRATRDGILGAILALVEAVEEGDQVLLHVSGHGSRVSTVVPAKREQGLVLDECVLPCDVGAPGSGYLRDVEIGELVERLGEAGALVTLTMDCCHGGGTVRGDDLETSIRLVREDDIPSPIGPASPVPTSPLGSWEELGRRWARRAGLGPIEGDDDPAGGGARRREAHRNISLPRLGESGWMELPERASFLAACAAHETARELTRDGGQAMGAFTHHLLEALTQLTGPLTYRRLHDQLLIHLTRGNRPQTPVLEGEADRAFLGVDSWPLRPSILVRSVEEEQGLIELDAGMVQGLRPGARLVHRPSFPVRTDSSRRQSPDPPQGKAGHVLEVVDAGGLRSVARIVDAVRSGGRIQAGDRVELLDLGMETGVAGVRLLLPASPSVAAPETQEATEAPEKDLSMEEIELDLPPGPSGSQPSPPPLPGPASNRREEGLSAGLGEALERHGQGWVQLVETARRRPPGHGSPGQASPDAGGESPTPSPAPGSPPRPSIRYQVSLERLEDGRRVWRLRDGAGGIVPMVGGDVSAEAPGSLDELARRITHLARFEVVQGLRNPDPTSPLAQELGVEVFLPPSVLRGSEASGSADSGPAGSGGRPQGLRLRSGELIDSPQTLWLLIENRGWEPLHVAMVILTPEWSIEQLWPRHADTVTLEPQERIRVTPKFYLPEAWPDHLPVGTDRIKIFATRDPTSFRWLEMPKLSGTTVPDGSPMRGREPTNPLERLFDRMTTDEPVAVRNAAVEVPSTHDWWVHEVVVRVRRAAASRSPSTPFHRDRQFPEVNR